MIPAQPGAHIARYEQKNEANGTTYYSTKAVVAWDADGAAQVVDHRSGRLVDASHYANFANVIEADTTPVVGAVPGGGWLAEYRDTEGETFTMTVVAWNVRADGTLDPICTDSGGITGDPTEDDGFVRLYLPADERQDSATS